MGAMEKSTHTADYRALREKLHEVRQVAALSQRELAARLGVSHTWVAKIESGERRIDLVEFCWFVKACDGDPVDILTKLVSRPGSFRTVAPRKGGRTK